MADEIALGSGACICSTACFLSPCLHDYLPDALLPDTPQQGQKFPLVPRKWLNSSPSSCDIGWLARGLLLEERLCVG